MKKINLYELQENLYFSDDVYTEDGVLIIGAFKKMDSFYLKSLEKWRITSFETDGKQIANLPGMKPKSFADDSILTLSKFYMELSSIESPFNKFFFDSFIRTKDLFFKFLRNSILKEDEAFELAYYIMESAADAFRMDYSIFASFLKFNLDDKTDPLYYIINALKKAVIVAYLVRFSKFSRYDCNVLVSSALLEDIGFIAIKKDFSYFKVFTLEDKKKLVFHPLLGAKILKKFDFLDEICILVEMSHENLLGTGYPMKVKPIMSHYKNYKFLSVVNGLFDFLLSNKNAEYSSATFRDFLENKDRKYDSSLINILFNIFKKFCIMPKDIVIAFFNQPKVDKNQNNRDLKIVLVNRVVENGIYCSIWKQTESESEELFANFNAVVSIYKFNKSKE